MSQHVLSRTERETILLTNAAEDLIDIGTCDPLFIRKLERLCNAFPDAYTRNGMTPSGDHAYLMPKNLLHFGKPPSEARRAQAARMRDKARNALADKENSGLPPAP